MALNHRRIGLLATGNEIIHGDILNSNAQYIAHELFKHQLEPGLQLAVSDTQIDIENGIHYLLEMHDVLITVGGLGPTSDDRTRFALSEALKLDLVFDDLSWKRIVERLTKFGFEVPDTNRQQCLFPQNAKIIPNEQGTAAACYLAYQNKHIFMLPGPPKELIPIFDSVVIPQLMTLGLQTSIERRSWLLLGIGEGNLANIIDPIAEKTDAEVGYRVSFPYVELKISAENKKTFETLREKIESLISPYIISRKLETASEQLYQYLKNSKISIKINDTATHGFLQTKLISPQTFSYIHFNDSLDANITIEVTGLQEYWEQKETEKTELLITIKKINSPSQTIKKALWLRGNYTVVLAVELICWEILQYFHK